MQTSPFESRNAKMETNGEMRDNFSCFENWCKKKENRSETLSITQLKFFKVKSINVKVLNKNKKSILKNFIIHISEISLVVYFLAYLKQSKLGKV